jgi:hypothetical protein
VGAVAGVWVAAGSTQAPQQQLLARQRCHAAAQTNTPTHPHAHARTFVGLRAMALSCCALIVVSSVMTAAFSCGVISCLQ